MKTSIHTPRRLVAVATVLVLAMGGVAAYAATASQTHATAARGVIVNAITTNLGITANQLRTDLAGGQTLAQIATADGKSVTGLEQAILAATQTRLDQAVAAGNLTTQNEQLILTRVSTRLGTLMNVKHPAAHLLIALRLRAGIVHVTTQYLSLTRQQLRSELRSGKTLAQVALENGKTASGLEQAISTAVQSRLDQAVAAGKLATQREQTMLSNLQTRLDTLINHSFTG